MRLLTFRKEGTPRVGALKGGGVIDLSDAFGSLLALIEEGEEGLRRAGMLVSQRTPSFALDDVEVLAPIPEPRRNVFCVGWNYKKHFDEGIGRRGGQETERPSVPNFFTKATRSVVGPGAPIPSGKGFTEQLDYEAELAVILGRTGRDIPEEEALDYVFGYTLANDVTARDVQHRTGIQWFKGKSMDGSCPLGPHVVTKEEVADPQDLRVQCYVNGELRQDSSTELMVFSVRRLIAELSQAMTLLPGDILLTGTPPGVGWGMTPPAVLKPGDEVLVRIPGLGELKNIVVP